MKKLLANLALVLGIALAAHGLLSVPFIQYLLPADLVSPLDSQSSRYWRAVPAEPQDDVYPPYVILAAGLALCMAGVVSRRRLGGTIA
jgi:hypothetical protein